MSDVSAVEVIAGVLRKHGRTPESHPIGGHAPLYRCGCDPLGQPPRWSGTEHAQHVAVEVDKALGGLARERKPVNQKNRAKPCGNCGHLKGVHAEPCVILVRDGLGVHECGCPERQQRLEDDERNMRAARRQLELFMDDGIRERITVALALLDENVESRSEAWFDFTEQRGQ